MILTDPVASIPKIGPAVTKLLSRYDINTIEDLLLYLPYKYLDFTKFTTIKDIIPGEIVTVRGTIKTIQSRFSFKTRKALCEAIISDTTGSLKVTWFNQSYLAKTLASGDEVLLSGKVEMYKGLQLLNPVHEKITQEMIHTGRLVPVYTLPDGLYNRTFRGYVNQILGLTNQLEDIIPPNIRNEYSILPLADAIKQLHFPESNELLEKSKLRMIFEEVFVQQLAVQKHVELLEQLSAPSIPGNIELTKEFIAKLPFTLTNAQKKGVWQIFKDLEFKHPMNRLLQGDVGSGKTIVALLAALSVIDAGYQVALLAPTEILARQHYGNFLKYLTYFKKSKYHHIGLLTRNFHELQGKTVPKKKLHEQVAKGTVTILIGTHAVLQETVAFKKLALVIIDEQHRFGVEQRAKLIRVSEKTSNTFYPHLLSMSATPIPRTLALSFYSDLAISTLDELPKGRQEIKTSVITEISRNRAYEFIAKEVTAGRQAFIITPLVEESEKLQFKSVKAEYERLKSEIFPTLKVGLLHGKMKGIEKDSTMKAFSDKEFDILVATSVIEIGIDIPNASVIVIEGSERFGLAQLHQLRGRVGRGADASYCLLFAETQDRETLARLQFFASCTDGFKLAEMDLKTRGFGSLFGNRQTGFDFKFGKYLSLHVLELAKKAVRTFREQHTLEEFPKLREKVEPLVEQVHLE